LLRDASNGVISNTATVMIVILALILAVVSIPLTFLGKS
jgi:hypothetical protein